MSWSIKRIRDLVKIRFKKRACLFQIKVARALRERQNDVVAIAATGSGKTLSFWIPLLMALEDKEDKCIIIVTPLNLLGKQNIDLLSAAGLSGIAIDRRNATDETFRDIIAGKYHMMVINPEILMQEGGHCEGLWKTKSFTSRLLYMVFDEGHCIHEWNSFREQYKYLGSLRQLIPETVPFYVTSATLPDPLLADVAEILQLHKGQTEHIFRSNDCPDIALSVRQMEHAAHTFRDLEFLIASDFKEGDILPPKFLVFCNSVKETEAVCRYLRSRLPKALQRDKIRYFHASMSTFFRIDEFEAFRDGNTFGLCVTDAFGMGLDLTGIQVIVQWKTPMSMNTLWQRFGRAARGPGEYTFAFLIAEKQYFDEEVQKKLNAKEKKREREMRKRQKNITRDSPQKKKAKPNPNDRPRPSTSSAIPPLAAPTIAVQVTDVEHASVSQLGSGSDADDSDSNSVNAGQPTGVTVPKKDKGERTPQPAILDFINADVRNIGCRRRVMTLVYSNDKHTFDHRECDDNLPSGCSRCAPMTSIVCCDLCDPTAFAELTISGTRSTRALRKSTIKKYNPAQQERDLRHALLKWRDEETVRVVGAAAQHIHGSSVTLPLPILQCIVDCAQAGKLASTEDFKHKVQVRADWANQYMSTILEIVCQIYPPVAASEEQPATVPSAASGAPSHLPLDSPAAASSSSTRQTKTWQPRKRPTCSVCGQVGHISECSASVPLHVLIVT
ncbi:P-loop containing nucleoside triphosphate hydrolase protein [Fomitopsis serialis]|uniref:P-loop containing nucleoside triphosphate hydrolase protein n=1 Tax=Fomitopsis serialis TaxID=139415 RepID=UPI0020081F40|nr:P-loop containing nucleoside triphosphate hydrolase protein [Neoantrodia serialis]KAH9911457.1 P-loop containing nucleoside triphosphate hydrolase protein [Neoantrodia serialis]